MLISLNEIKKLVKIPASVSTEDLITLIGSRLVEVEGYADWSERYQGIYIVKVVACQPIEGTHLHLCKIDAGEAGAEFAADFAIKHPNSELTNDENLVQVVCGAPNVHEGMLAVWISPGSVVPSTWDDEHFELSVRPLRGYDSYGMLSGADELGLDTEHKFIAEIDPKTQVADGTGSVGTGSFRPVRPGDSFAEVFDLNDIILDIENKSLTHRPDTFGLIGFAREVASILGIKFEEPVLDFNLEKGFKKTAAGLAPISIDIKDSALCPRYSAAVFEVSSAKLESATEATKYLTADTVFLAKAGMRAISKIVDATNIVMLLTGQPLHAFDYDKFVSVGGDKSAKIIVRAAKPSETLTLLDGKTIDLNESDIIITSNDIPVALAGAMGGASTEIDASTKRVILESATFSLYNERKTQMAHGIFSEAITRFTKGQPAFGTIPALERCASLLLDSPAEVADFEDAYPDPAVATQISLTVSDVNSILGSAYSVEQITTTLENVGFIVKSNSTTLTVTAPLWRTDIHIKEDVIEEVGRLNGYDNIPAVLPLRPFTSAPRNRLFDLKSELRSILSDRLGAHEILTYSFVSKNLQQKCGEDIADSYEIINSISPELECFRQSLTPSLLDKLAKNQKSGFTDFSLYEFNQVTRKSLGLTSENVPALENHLAYVITGGYYSAKSTLSKLADILHIKLAFKPVDTKSTAAIPPYIETLHAVEVWTKDENDAEIYLGILGEIRHSVATKLKIEGTVSAFELDLERLLNATRDQHIHLHFSKFPSTTRDVTLKVSPALDFATIENAIVSTLEATPDLVYTVQPVSIYAPEPAEKSALPTRNLSFRLTFASTKKTLEATEISAIMNNIEHRTHALGAETI